MELAVEGDGTGVFGFDIFVESLYVFLVFELVISLDFSEVELVSFIDFKLLLVAFSRLSCASWAFDKDELEEDVEETESDEDGCVIADEERLDLGRLPATDETGSAEDGMGPYEECWSLL